MNDPEEFLRTSLREMNFPADDLTPDTLLGPDGIDLDSLARAEIALRISDDYGVELTEEETKEIASQTAGQLVALIRSRTGAAD